MALTLLPVEMHWEVASYLDSDRDLANYSQVCRSTYYAIEEPSKNFWRHRFLKTYDPPTHSLSADVLQQKYKQRSAILRKSVYFRNGDTRDEKTILQVLRELVKEANPFRESAVGCGYFSQSKNFERLQFVIRNTNLMHIIGFREMPNQSRSILMQTIQTVLSAFFLDPRYGFEHVGFLSSQKAVYESLKAAPIFHGNNKLQVNIPWVLNVVNFFKRHLVHLEEQTMAIAYRGLLHDVERPQPWDKPLQPGSSKLGKYWMGTYSYIERHEMPLIRRLSPDSGSFTFQDMNINAGEEAIQRLRLEFPEEKMFDFPWPRLFEYFLKSLPKNEPPKPKRMTRAQHRKEMSEEDIELQDMSQYKNLRFIGNGYDDETFLSSGWLNPLPPQQGIPGWQRVTMMKYFVDPITGHMDDDALWAYEGVVLPGGQIMVGRWWSPEVGVSESDIYSGPFIFWNVDASKPDDFLGVVDTQPSGPTSSSATL